MLLEYGGRTRRYTIHFWLPVFLLKINHEFIKCDYSERARFVNALRKFLNFNLLGPWSDITAPICERCIHELLLLAIRFMQCLCDGDNSVMRVSSLWVWLPLLSSMNVVVTPRMSLKVKPPPSNHETKALQMRFPGTSRATPLLQNLWKPARRNDWLTG